MYGRQGQTRPSSRPDRVLATGALLAAALVGLAACTDSPSELGGGDGEGVGKEPTPETTSCDLDMDFVADGDVGRDGIPALTDPATIPAEQAEARGTPAPDDRVVGLVVGNEDMRPRI